MASISRLLTALLSGSDGLGRVASASLTAVGVAAASLARRPAAHRGNGRLPDGRLGGSLEDSPAAHDALAQAGPWTAARLKQVLREHLHGERVVVVANREPCIHDWKDGRIEVRHPASGLVTALEPVMRACSGVWVAHGSGTADRDAADLQGRVEVGAAGASYTLRRVWLTDEEEQGYYYGFANEALWPLCHLAHGHPTFRRSDFAQYRRVNQRFADAVASEVDCDDPIVLVQDYHFALAPRMIRERFPKATILTFWHIPWPNAERFSICPFGEEVLEGLLGSSLVGFQTYQHCHNFLESVDRSLEVRVERHDMSVICHRRPTLVRPYPISIEWPSRWSDSAPAVAECRRLVRRELGLPDHAQLVVSVDRMDYTKGIEERLLTIERTLERRPGSAPPLAFLQVGAPSRVRIDRYRQFGDHVRAEVDRINARFSTGPGGHRPITLVDRHCEPPEVFGFYRAADVFYVSSLHDGMNLVAKEFISARDDERGVLLLSRFAGASRELAEAIIVNPYDVEGVSDALQAALEMPDDEQRERMRSMRLQVSEHNVYRWAGRMLLGAARLRRRERLQGRLGAAADEPAVERYH
jgi:trehalose 6-phosphate synthase